MHKMFLMMGIGLATLMIPQNVSAQQMSDMAPFSEFSVGTVSRAVALGNITAQAARLGDGTNVIQFVYDGIVMNVEPRECDRNGRGCQAAVIRSFFDVPADVPVTRLLQAVDDFNRANAFLKASVEGQNRVNVSRYHSAHFGIHYGTVRREYANFAQSFNLLIQQYVSPVVGAR